ncbi:ATP-dependent Clp protease proteolytic subunit [Streptomyces gamaensis]|uniref:ATP-dependent Clp protease proteolytic subunit n=1 Tax=Streptomyces gamaensis TaxID=1763542 RepID=A0ABW0Z3P5_9ACTN
MTRGEGVNTISDALVDPAGITTDPYGKLLSERIVVIGTAIDDTCAGDVIAQLMYLEHAAPERDVSLYINSPGGSVEAMTAIHDTMAYVCCDVETVCLGQAASAAAVLLAAGAPGKRLALPHARFVLRQPSLDGPVRGTPTDLGIHAGELERARGTVEALLARYTGHGPQRIRRDTERETVLDAAAARAYGLVDHVVTGRREQAARFGAGR